MAIQLQRLLQEALTGTDRGTPAQRKSAQGYRLSKPRVAAAATTLLLLTSCTGETGGSRQAAPPTATAAPTPPPPSVGTAGPRADEATAASYDGQQHQLTYYSVVGGQVRPFATQPLPGCTMSQLSSLDGDLLVLCRSGHLTRVHPGRAGTVARTLLTAPNLGFAKALDLQVDGIVPDSTTHTIFVYGRVQRPNSKIFEGFSLQLAGGTLKTQTPATTSSTIIQTASASHGRILTVGDDGKLRPVPANATSTSPQRLLSAETPSLMVNSAAGGQWVVGANSSGDGLVVTPAGRQVRTPSLDTYAATETSTGDLLAVHRVGNVFSLLRITRDGAVSPCGADLAGQPLGMVPTSLPGKALLFLHGPQGQAGLLDLRTCVVAGQYDTPSGEVDFTSLH